MGNMSKLDNIRSILSARGAKNAAELPQLATGAPLLTPSPIKGLINLTCRDPFISDPGEFAFSFSVRAIGDDLRLVRRIMGLQLP